MSIRNGVVAMDLDGTGFEEPSTPSRDPTSSPVVHIQWQNSQSACAAIEELRVASSVPRRLPQPLTFDFELPVSSAGPSSSTSDSDPFRRTRLRSVRSRALQRVQSQSQNDICAIPAADASKFLDMLGRASARVDENSRKRMKTRECGARSAQRSSSSSIKGKERVMVTRSMDELGDHTNFVRDMRDTGGSGGVRYSSLPIMMQSKDPQSKQTGSAMREADKGPRDHHQNDVLMQGADDAPPAPPGGADFEPPLVSTRKTQQRPRISQKRIEPPSPTPVRSATPTTLRHPVPVPPKPSGRRTSAPPKSTTTTMTTQGPPPLPPPPHLSASAPLSSSSSAFSKQQPVLGPPPPPPPMPLQPPAADGLPNGGGAVMTAESFPRRGIPTPTPTPTTSMSTLPASQTHGSRRALGMTRTVPRASSNTTTATHTAAVKKPFRPPLPRPAPAAAAMVPRVNSATSYKSKSPMTQHGQDDRKGGTGADPDSSFDMSFDFDPEELEAAMKKFD